MNRETVSRIAAAVAKRSTGALAHALRTLAVLAGAAVGALLVAAAAGGLLVYSGWYSVGAVEPQTPIGEWVIRTTMQRSVQARAQDVVVPDLDRMERLWRGAAHYRTSCEACHRGPGVARSDIARALNPAPSDLSLTARRWTDGELFWIIKHGLRMSGMPQWGRIYSDDELWDIVSFVSMLPRMTASEYAEYRGAPNAHVRAPIASSTPD